VFGFIAFGNKSARKKIDFFGSGRFTLNNSSLSGKLIDKDTTTARKQMVGGTLFDLGFHIRPSENTEIKAITRVQNEINGFWVVELFLTYVSYIYVA